MYYNYGEKEKEYLKSKDPILAKAINQIGHIERKMIPEFFPALTDSIISQQISGKAADTVLRRLMDLLGAKLIGDIKPEAIDKLEIDQIQKCGMSFNKANYIKGAAQALIRGEIIPDELKKMDDDEVIKKLTSLKGIGVWTAEMLLIFSFGRQDVLSYNDLAIRRGIKKLYGYEELTKEQFLDHKETYSPYGTVASLYIWAWSV